MKISWPMVPALVLILSATVSVAALTPEKSLNNCQNAVRMAGGRFAKQKLAAIQACLQAVSVDIIKNNKATPSKATAKTCVNKFRKIYDSRGKGVSLEEKKVAAIDKKCDPTSPNVTHNENDITGNTGGNAPSPGINSSNLSDLCSAGTLASWIQCIDAIHECAVDLMIATEYPRALEWLGLLQTAIGALPPPPKSDPNRNSDALVGLQGVQSEIHGLFEQDPNKPNIACPVVQNT